MKHTIEINEANNHESIDSKKRDRAQGPNAIRSTRSIRAQSAWVPNLG